MAAIDYHDIEDTVRDTINTATASGSNIYVTAEVNQPMNTNPWVAIYMQRRVDSDIQVCAGGTIKKYSLEFSIWCWGWSLDNSIIAAKTRDDLLGFVEVTLMDNRKMGGKIDNGTIHGGEFKTVEANKGYMSGAEIIYRAEVKATT